MARIRERQRHRERIARLAVGDSPALSPEVVDFLDRLRALGFDEARPDRLDRLDRLDQG